MNTNMIRFVLVLSVLLCAPVANAFLSVDWNTVTYLPYGYDGFILSTDSDLGEGATVWGILSLDPGGSWIELTANNGTAGISHQWFEVDYEEPVTTGTADISNPLLISKYATPPEFGTIHLDLNQSFYLGFQLGGYAGDVGMLEFGWVELLFDGTDVTALSSATERTGVGIYAGTGTPIPEPATVALILLGTAGLAWRRQTRLGTSIPDVQNGVKSAIPDV